MSELKRPERYVQFESIKPELKEITEFYTRKVTDYQYRLKQLNEYADALENEISVLKETPKVEVLLDDMPKPLVVVPEFVADWFEKNEDDLSFKIWGYLINWKIQDKKSDFFKWMKKESECIEILIRMQDGYTVEKEQLYCLKHIDLSDTSKSDVDYFLCDIDGSLGHLWENKGLLPEVENAHFTQSEIDKLNIGSYEQIEVKVEEVEK